LEKSGVLGSDGSPAKVDGSVAKYIRPRSATFTKRRMLSSTEARIGVEACLALQNESRVGEDQLQQFPFGYRKGLGKGSIR
jgi:hypothetical protein